MKYVIRNLVPELPLGKAINFAATVVIKLEAAEYFRRIYYSPQLRNWLKLRTLKLSRSRWMIFMTIVSSGSFLTEIVLGLEYVEDKICAIKKRFTNFKIIWKFGMTKTILNVT